MNYILGLLKQRKVQVLILSTVLLSFGKLQSEHFMFIACCYMGANVFQKWVVGNVKKK